MIIIQISLDASFPTSSYKSWIDLENAFLAGNNLSKKMIGIQGSPNVTMWVASWNAKGNNKLYLKVDSAGYGYRIGQNDYYFEWSIEVSNIKGGIFKDNSGTGYNDELYFIEHNTNDKAERYWLASPGANENWLGSVVCNGHVACSSTSYSKRASCRPVVAISTSDFNNMNLEKIIIQ